MKIYTEETGLGDWIKFVDVEYTDRLTEAELILFPGGADVHPSFYNEKPGSWTHADKSRDLSDIGVFEYAKRHNIPMIGICRGSQLLCVANGGKLIQHVTGHNDGFHQIITDNKRLYAVNSVHHQMLDPFMLPVDKFHIIASSIKVSKKYLNGDDKEILVGGYTGFVEPEIVWFPKTRSLAIQSHPEYLSMPKETLIYLNKVAEKYIMST